MGNKGTIVNIILPDNGRRKIKAMKNEMSRKDKIKLLQDIEAGKADAQELNIKDRRSCYVDENGLYTTDDRSKMSEAEFQDYITKHPAHINIIYRPQPGNEPLIDNDGQK